MVVIDDGRWVRSMQPETDDDDGSYISDGRVIRLVVVSIYMLVRLHVFIVSSMMNDDAYMQTYNFTPMQIKAKLCYYI